MSGVRRGARSVVKWFSALYVVLIIVQVFLAGEGVFRLKNVYDSDTCKKAASHCGGSTTLDPHRVLGFILTEPLAILFLIAALLAWHPDKRVRIVSIVAPILTFVQLVLAVVGKWVGGLHVLNAILILGMYGWLAYTLRHEQPSATQAEPATSPVD
jgi:heme A synthase